MHPDDRQPGNDAAQDRKMSGTNGEGDPGSENRDDNRRDSERRIETHWETRPKCEHGHKMCGPNAGAGDRRGGPEPGVPPKVGVPARPRGEAEGGGARHQADQGSQNDQPRIMSVCDAGVDAEHESSLPPVSLISPKTI